MSTVQEIEDAIRKLPQEDLAHLRTWLAEYDAERWDKQIEQDAAAGHFDAFADEALSDLRDGRCTDL